MSALTLWRCFRLFVVIGVVRETVAQHRNLCDVCECLPTRNESSYVNCNCQKSTRSTSNVLIISEEDADVLANTKVLNISSCTFVSFPAAGFPKAKKLKSWQIRQINGLFHMNVATFPAATSLMIDDINEIVMEHNVGQSNLISIEIKNSVVNEISEDVLKEVKSLEKLIFQNVTINTIASNALNITNNSPKLSVKFLNSKIDNIHSNAISLQVNKLEVVNTFINGISPLGLIITASDSIEFVRCTFGPELADESFQINSNKVNIVENEFKVLPKNLLREVHLLNDRTKINFISNTIYDVDLGGFILPSLHQLNFAKNKIVCDCTPRKTSLLKLRNVFPGLLPNDSLIDTIIESNSCKNYNGISLSDFKRKFLPKGMCNETDAVAHELPESLRQPATEISTDNSSVSLSYSYYSYVLIYLVSNIFFSYAR